MKIILDAMGGDFAPLEVVKGAALAAGQYPQANLVLVGDEGKIRSEVNEACTLIDGVQMVHTSLVLSL